MMYRTLGMDLIVHRLQGNEVYVLGHILSGPSIKHDRMKIDPSFLIWLLPYHTTRFKEKWINFDPSMLHTKPRQNMP